MTKFTPTYTDVYDRLFSIRRNIDRSLEGSVDYARYGLEYDEILFSYISHRDYIELVKKSSNITDWVAFDAGIVYNSIGRSK